MKTIDLAKSLIDGIMSPSCIVDRHSRIVYTNYEFLELAKISQRDIRRGITCSECLNFEIFSDGHSVLEKLFASREPVKLREIKGKNAHDEYLSVGVSCLPLSADGRDSELALVVFSNLTLEENVQEKYKVLYEKERQERRKLEEFNERLNELVEERTLELGETHRKLKTAYTALNEELEMAKNVQTALLPREFPVFANMQLASAYVPTGKVGGDLFDIVKTPAGKIAVLIYDVSGHGAPAALIGAMAKMLFVRFLERLTSPAKIFAQINTYICNSIKTDHYLTAFLALIDPETNHMVYSRAAHPSPVVFRKKADKTETLEGKGLFIGHAALAKVAKYDDQETRFSEGDKILFYTDGITEATDPAEEMFGTQRLAELVIKHHELAVEEMVDSILKDHAAFTKGTPLRDDFTLMCLEFGPCSKSMLQSGFAPDQSPNTLTFRTFDEIEKVCAVILREIDANGFSEQEIWSAKLCMHEAFINALLHGNESDPEKKATVLYDVTPDEFRISIIDEGKGFDHSSLPDPKNDENLLKDGGRGLYFIRQYMDEVLFNDRGNRIMLIKRHTEGE